MDEEKGVQGSELCEENEGGKSKPCQRKHVQGPGSAYSRCGPGMSGEANWLVSVIFPRQKQKRQLFRCI